MITVGKKLSRAQWEAFNEAQRHAMHTQAMAMQEAMELYCGKYGVEFPATGNHGGARKGAGRPKSIPDEQE
jgi:hypothetical protein